LKPELVTFSGNAAALSAQSVSTKGVENQLFVLGTADAGSHFSAGNPNDHGFISLNPISIIDLGDF